ncbi:DNA replication/repair protein RecF [Paracoccus sp. Z330]|uniref:DNA replication and repair protein RecF n=1 Tax=Paracoccus onchidii TaxID=3017813 RepID=A0ABT4ZKL0_9RHOB|nr:DNA replication/repair protein RecF [Paracoccus onchidii]MDB6179265.1 DNA replication/repair protein RecF [Paracoccus onchidii]
MTLDQISLAQFRSWSRLELQIDHKPIAIHGPNGSGKTNILEAVSMLAPGRGLRGAPAPDQARQAKGAGWRIRAQIDDHQIDTTAPPGKNRQVSLDDKQVPQTALARLLRIIWLVPSMDRLWTDPPDTRRRFLDRLTLSLFPDHAELALTYEKAMRERNRLLRDQINDPGWYRALEGQMAQSGSTLTANRIGALAAIMAAQRYDPGGFPAATLSLLPGEGHADDTHADSIAARLAEMRPRDLAAGRSLTGPHRADLGAHWGPQEMPAALSSTGEQKALLLSLILANARALPDQPVILLLDEVAAHLDADRRARLYDQIVDLKAQTFLTGTGAELFQSFGSRARRLEIGKTDGQSHCSELP